MLCLTFELMECNLYELYLKTTLNEQKVKLWMFQVFKGLDYLHSQGIFHRDIKPENILVRGSLIKIADLGSCRRISSKILTDYIATRWYRPPEVLLGCRNYSFKMDIWGVGCVLYESLTRKPLFAGANTVDQLHKIHKILGSPRESQLRLILGHSFCRYTFPYSSGTGIPIQCTVECLNLLNLLLSYLPTDRPTAFNALQSQFFKHLDLTELPTQIQKFYNVKETKLPRIWQK